MHLTLRLLIAVLACSCGANPPDAGDPTAAAATEATSATDVSIDLTLQDDAGRPWRNGVSIRVGIEVPSESVDSEEVAYFFRRGVPDPRGQVDLRFRLPALGDSGPPKLRAEIIVHGNEDLNGGDNLRSTYIDPAVGAGARLGWVPLDWDRRTRSYGAEFDVTIAEPPLYGTVTLSRPTVGPHGLYCGDVLPESYVRSGLRSLVDHHEELVLPEGTTSIALHRWSQCESSRIAILGLDGIPLGGEVLRRGGTVEIDLLQVRRLEVRVDRSVYPEARALMVLLPRHHQPDASAPSGSLVTFDERARRRLIQVNLRDRTDELIPLTFVDRDFVVELWEDWLPPGSDRTETRLVDHEAVPAGTDFHRIEFCSRKAGD